MGNRLTTIDIARKVGEAAVPLSVGGELGTYLTLSPRPRSTSIPSVILNVIHPTVWPQYTNITDMTDRADRRVAP